MISNIIRRSLREISDGNADGNLLEKNVSTNITDKNIMAAFFTHSLLFFPPFSFILILLYTSLSICIPAVGSMPVYPQKISDPSL